MVIVHAQRHNICQILVGGRGPAIRNLLLTSEKSFVEETSKEILGNIGK
jgi:hypothetical protein